jgi:hypothetical protein
MKTKSFKVFTYTSKILNKKACFVSPANPQIKAEDKCKPRKGLMNSDTALKPVSPIRKFNLTSVRCRLKAALVFMAPRVRPFFVLLFCRERRQRRRTKTHTEHTRIGATLVRRVIYLGAHGLLIFTRGTHTHNIDCLQHAY